MYYNEELPERIGQPDCEVHLLGFYWLLYECIIGS